MPMDTKMPCERASSRTSFTSGPSISTELIRHADEQIMIVDGRPKARPRPEKAGIKGLWKRDHVGRRRGRLRE